jgi:hypothetical protein
LKLINDLSRVYPLKEYVGPQWAAGVIRVCVRNFKSAIRKNSEYAVEMLKFIFNFEEEHLLAEVFPLFEKFKGNPEIPLKYLEMLVKILHL